MDGLNKDIPEIGWHDVTCEEYLNWDLCSQSRLGAMRRSPKHCYDEIVARKESTPAQGLGTIIHTAILEPELYDLKYAVLPDVDKRFKENKEIIAKFKAENLGKIWIDHEENETALKIRDAAIKNSQLQLLLKAGKGWIERSGVFRHMSSGVMCKFRPDLIVPDGFSLDLKSTRDARASSFSKTILNYGYDRQGAFYHEGCKALGVPLKYHIIVAVETDLTPGIKIYQLGHASMERGIRELEFSMQQYQLCMQTGFWPCYPEDIEEIDVPSWALTPSYSDEESDLGEIIEETLMEMGHESF